LTDHVQADGVAWARWRSPIDVTWRGYAGMRRASDVRVTESGIRSTGRSPAARARAGYLKRSAAGGEI